MNPRTKWVLELGVALGLVTGIALHLGSQVRFQRRVALNSPIVLFDNSNSMALAPGDTVDEEELESVPTPAMGGYGSPPPHSHWKGDVASVQWGGPYNVSVTNDPWSGAGKINSVFEAKKAGYQGVDRLSFSSVKNMGDNQSFQKRVQDWRPARPRAWFPQTLLFEPLIVTDQHGLATVGVKVPDTLTTWRVLALAHSRAGAQAGAVTKFLGTLPTYVDPVVPPELRVGDDVRVPIMIVSSDAKAGTLPLRIEADGATIREAPKTVKLTGGTDVEMISFHVDRPGTITLHAVLGSADDVVRTTSVTPLGKPITEHRSGTLAAQQDLPIEIPADATEPGATVHLVAFPGALALLRSELGRTPARLDTTADHAHALLLAGRAPELMKTLGGTLDQDALTKLTLLASQRVIADGRVPSPDDAALLIEASLAHPDNRILAKLGERLCASLAAAQHPDGTFGDAGSAQIMLVTTAESVQALRAGMSLPSGHTRATGASVRASGAFERYLPQLNDAYTASAVVVSGSVPAGLAEKLRDTIRPAVVTSPDGTRRITIPEGTVRPDGVAPTNVDTAALAILALDPDKDAALRAELGSVLLASYSPSSGWGDGRTNLVALRAVASLFTKPLPDRVMVRLEMDGQPLVQGSVDARHGDVLSLDAPVQAAGKHTWTVSAEPPLAGLGYSLDVVAYGQWKNVAHSRELSLAAKLPKDMRAGTVVDMSLEVAGPEDEPVTVVYSLPAGVQALKSSLEALEESSTISDYAIDGRNIRFEVPPIGAGETTRLDFRVMPTLSGHLHAGVSSVSLRSQLTALASYVPPATWDIH